MAIGPLRVAALLASILVGMSAGVVAAELRDETAATTANPGDTDPLDLGTQLVNLDCTGESILILRGADTRPTLRTSVTDNPGAVYLETSESCPTAYEGTDSPTPKYVVYLGPYELSEEPCRMRLTVEHEADVVTRLKAGNEDLVKCMCEIPLADGDWPVLEPGMEPAPLERLYIRQLQGMFIDRGLLDYDMPSGEYDQPTIAAVDGLLRRFSTREPRGVVDAETWRIVRERMCPQYDY